MSDKTPADILDQAANVIERNGWTQHEFYLPVGVDGLAWASRRGVLYKDSKDCPVCTGGGINIAADCTPDLEDIVGFPDGAHGEAVYAFARHIDPDFGGDHTMFGSPYTVIGAWNDDSQQTAEQVVAELRACAAHLRNEAPKPTAQDYLDAADVLIRDMETAEGKDGGASC